MNTQQLDSSENIDIMVVIDTDYIRKNCKNPSQDPNNPSQIDHNCEYMVCNGKRGVTGQGTADLAFSANPGDNVHFRGTSIYGNSDDAIIIYGITPINPDPNDDGVFNDFEPSLVQRKGAAVPNLHFGKARYKDNNIVAENITLNFVSYCAQVKAKGEEGFHIQFALYTLDGDGETQNLFGYFEWDPSISVN
ncbi:inclusion body family protein [Clostridium felsineum]|uniref:inclusion body family protein n=1 Tax=Clostridium felsineum TaxID=36839 RepID=UPI00098C17E5|nr:inclusion body family protein [Clostridium felsineum]URZ18392.1 hypothetical protein CLFE_044620 [Clostridium felsineum DSM 794]